MQNIISTSDNIQIWHETFGNKKHPALLLIMGNSCDAFMWPDSFCRQLADQGLHVIRFDQRDTGLSTWIDFSQTPYTLLDMVKDAIGLLDALEIPQAHIVGFSTGGAIAQLFAIHFPQRVRSLTLMMTSIDLTIKNDAFRGLDTSHAKLPPPKQEFIQAVLQVNAKQPSTLPEKISQLVENFHLANGSKAAFDKEFFYRLLERSLKRVEGTMQKIGHQSNHALATSATPLIKEQEFAKISAPTLVIAGSEDPIFPPAHARAMAEAIPHARLLVINGMGHTLNPVFFDHLIKPMAHHMLAL